MSMRIFQLKPNSLDADTGITNHDYEHLMTYLEHSDCDDTWFTFYKKDFDESIGPRILKDIEELNLDEVERDILRDFYDNLIRCRNKYPEDDSVDLIY